MSKFVVWFSVNVILILKSKQSMLRNLMSVICDTMAGSFVNFSLLEALTSILSTIGTFDYCYRQTFHSKINIFDIFQIIKCLVLQKICVLESCSPVSHYLIMTTMPPPCARLPGEWPTYQDEAKEEPEGLTWTKKPEILTETGIWETRCFCVWSVKLIFIILNTNIF